MSRTLKVAWGSLGVSVIVLAMKYTAYPLTGSIALYSDALETVINVVAAGGALIAVWFSERPADANHPYGHHKAEYLSAVVEGALVLATAVLIGRETWQAWEHPRAPETPLRPHLPAVEIPRPGRGRAGRRAGPDGCVDHGCGAGPASRWCRSRAGCASTRLVAAFRRSTSCGPATACCGDRWSG